jgi:hypothetical protein
VKKPVSNFAFQTQPASLQNGLGQDVHDEPAPHARRRGDPRRAGAAAVGLCRLNQDDPYPIAYTFQTHNLKPIKRKTGFKICLSNSTCSATPRNSGLVLWVSFFEIYGGKVYDLLNGRRKLVIRGGELYNLNPVHPQLESVSSTISAACV